jgi:hypothetical protein
VTVERRGPRVRAAAALGVWSVLFVAASASAQNAYRFELSGGLNWTGPVSAGKVDANETTPNGGALRLFTTESDFAAAIGFDARVGIRATRKLQAEAQFSYARPMLKTRLTSDLEGASSVVATERVRQFAAGGGLLVQLTNPRSDRRALPFVTAAASVLRQLHESDTLAQNGAVVSAGGGMHYSFGGRTGIRAEGGVVVHTSRLSFDGRLHLAPKASVSLFRKF